VKIITPEKVVLVSTSDASDLRNVTHDYAGSHLHLGYATTVYGVQGETTDLSLVGPGVDAAGLYVGLTRGKQDNSVVLVAPTETSAKSQLLGMMQRRTIEETLQKSRAAARVELNRAAQVSVNSALPVSPEIVDVAATL
jgi:ATP-dependent exoDNAse (exonuclease V) alpha subunit